jgi:hypothetical protein
MSDNPSWFPDDFTPIATHDSDGIILPDWPFAKYLGFTSKKWKSGSYMWRTGDFITTGMLIAQRPGRGSFRSLASRILQVGYGLMVPNPIRDMPTILTNHNFVLASINMPGSPFHGSEVWVKNRGKKWK